MIWSQKAENKLFNQGWKISHYQPDTSDKSCIECGNNKWAVWYEKDTGLPSEELKKVVWGYCNH